jgi:hypothetical protein
MSGVAAALNRRAAGTRLCAPAPAAEYHEPARRSIPKSDELESYVEKRTYIVAYQELRERR